MWLPCVETSARVCIVACLCSLVRGRYTVSVVVFVFLAAVFVFVFVALCRRLSGLFSLAAYASFLPLAYVPSSGFKRRAPN